MSNDPFGDHRYHRPEAMTMSSGWPDNNSAARSHGERLSVAETRISHIADKAAMTAERVHAIANALAATNGRLSLIESDHKKQIEVALQMVPLVEDHKRRQLRRELTKNVLNWATVALMAYLAFAGREQWGSVLRALGKASVAG